MPQGIFEDDFPFPKVGYVCFLEGRCFSFVITCFPRDPIPRRGKLLANYWSNPQLQTYRRNPANHLICYPIIYIQGFTCRNWLEGILPSTVLVSVAHLPNKKLKISGSIRLAYDALAPHFSQRTCGEKNPSSGFWWCFFSGLLCGAIFFFSSYFSSSWALLFWLSCIWKFSREMLFDKDGQRFLDFIFG